MFSFSVVFIAMLGLETGCGLRWKDCASNPQTAAFTFNSFNIWPVPTVVPGLVHFSVDLTVNRDVHKLFVDEDVDELISKYLFKLPCIGEGIGSCSDVDVCHYQVVDIPEIWDKFMYLLLANESSCPIKSRSLVIQDESIHLPDLPMEIANLANRMFTVKLHFKDDRHSPDHIGCLEFDFEFDLPGLDLVGKK